MQNAVIAGGELIGEAAPVIAEIAKGIVYGAGGQLAIEAVNELKQGEQAIQDAVIKEVHALLTRLEEAGEDLIETVEEKVASFKHDRRRKRRRTAPPSDQALVTMVEDVRRSQPIALSVIQGKRGGSFIKMPGKRKFKGKTRGRKAKRSKKAVTKRGVKSMIARQAVFAGSWLWYCYSNKGFAGSYSTGAMSEYGLQHRGYIVFRDALGTLASLKTAVFDKGLNLPSTGAADQPQADTYTYMFRRCIRKIYFHSCMTENQTMTCWLLRQKQNNDNVPTNTWSTAWSDFAVTTGGSYSSMTFEQDFSTFPTEFREWRRNFEIVKKYQFGLVPGQTKMIKIKGHMRKVYNPEDDNVYNKGKDTHYLMYQIQGVPTHNGTTPTLTEINWSPTGVDIIWDEKFQFGANANNAKASYRISSRSTLSAAGKSLIPEVSTNITAV